MSRTLRVVIVKPSKYASSGYVERFRRGFMPNSTLAHIRSLTPASIDGCPTEVEVLDEYVLCDLNYLSHMKCEGSSRTLLALVGVQSHQFHRALDLAALARRRRLDGIVIGGPHVMTCDTSSLHGRGVSFALSEAETVWPKILEDALHGELAPTYGGEARWRAELDPPVLVPPTRRELRRYVVPMLGIYPARGCPYNCNFCSVIKIAGRAVRGTPIETTLESLRRAKAGGVKLVMFVSDNFNKYPEARSLLEAMIHEGIRLPIFVQCDAQIARQPEFVELLARAGCFQMFVGVESFDRPTLLAAGKTHNHPEQYREIVRLCREYGITSHFSNIIGFPSQTESGIRDHLERLKELSPDAASFYILTPIPGTEQYEDFRREGLIVEYNLDRFDGSVLTWRHPHFGAERLTELLFACHQKFYTLPHTLSRLLFRLRSVRDFRLGAELQAIVGHASLSRYASFFREHPMAGGVGRVQLDHLRDYLPLRMETFGLSLVPLPASLDLSSADEEINRHARLEPMAYAES